MGKRNRNSKYKNETSFIGCTAANLHEAGRSEYLAHYVFSSFGTAVPVPRQEDTGLDLQCTLTERVGQRLWPIASYSVQVKSTDDPWEFASPRSIEWIVKHPLPVFFCVVKKKTATLSIYHTSPRFHAWTAMPDLKRLVMVPGQRGNGHGTAWELPETKGLMEGEFPLSAPIAEFSLAEILDDEFHAKIRTVLMNWVEVDRKNIYRIQAGVRQFETISDYVTNKPVKNGTVRTWRSDLSEQEYAAALKPFVEQAKWFSHHFASKNDKAGYLRLDLLLRHLGVLDSITDGVNGFHLYSRLRSHFEPDPELRKKEFFAGLDGLSRKIDELTAVSIQEAEVAEQEEEANREARRRAQEAEASTPPGGSDDS